MLVVSDTTPLNYLILIQAENVLPLLYGSILVPSQVVQELKRPKTPEIVRAWIGHPPDWLVVQEGDASRFPTLDAGEAAALALALDRQADLLADDAEARVIATSVGILTIGTLGILAEAHLASLLDFDKAVSALRATNFRVQQSVITRVRKALALPD